MRQDRRTPDEVALVGVRETNFAGLAKGGFASDDKSKRDHLARAWAVTFRVHPKRRAFLVSISNNVTFVGFWGHTKAGNGLYAKLEAEFEGALAALAWLQHVPETPAQIKFSSVAFAVFLGEAPCPEILKPLLDRVRRAYVTAADSILIDRDRRALVARRGLRAA